MSNVLINQSTLTGIADAIRARSGSTEAFKPAQMISAITNMPNRQKQVIQGKLSSYYSNQLTLIAKGKFYADTNVFYMECPNVSSVGPEAFRGASIKSLSFKTLQGVGWGTFSMCYLLSSFYAPLVKAIGERGFQSCSSLTMLSFPSATHIQPYVFFDCKNLKSLYLYGSSMVVLSNLNAFSSSPMRVSTLAGGFGSVYVPSSLYSQYITATNWVNMSARIVSTPTSQINTDY